MPALQQAIDAVFDARIGDISGRGKLAADMREIWTMQPRFERRTANAAESLLASSRVFAPASTSCACVPTGEAEEALAQWWEDYSLANPGERPALLEAAREDEQQRRVGGGSVVNPSAPAKKRRRRRKPSAGRVSEEADTASAPSGSDD
jgi:poly(A) polymerase